MRGFHRLYTFARPSQSMIYPDLADENVLLESLISQSQFQLTTHTDAVATSYCSRSSKRSLAYNQDKVHDYELSSPALTIT